MALTRNFKETIPARVQRDPGFREALLREGIEDFLAGDVETGKIILRDFHQRHSRVSKIERNHTSFCKESDANARAAWQSPSEKSV